MENGFVEFSDYKLLFNRFLALKERKLIAFC